MMRRGRASFTFEGALPPRDLLEHAFGVKRLTGPGRSSAVACERTRSARASPVLLTTTVMRTSQPGAYVAMHNRRADRYDRCGGPSRRIVAMQQRCGDGPPW